MATAVILPVDGRYTSAAVEGINNKARVITKRCYGVKSSDTLWNRLILDLNRASEAVAQTIAELRFGRRRPEGRVYRVLQLKPEEPQFSYPPAPRPGWRADPRPGMLEAHSVGLRPTLRPTTTTTISVWENRYGSP